jgi:16S rRNA A1518/A1519 N6-dimethyltransferase RsmA/KsgA/DIM1 with predicted DNA glycosylase/AP lyase activity
VKQVDQVVDGSGDGRIVVMAAKKYGSQAVGYEIDPRLVAQSREKVQAEKLEVLARIEHQDIFTVDLSDADVVVVFLPSPLLRRLLPQFQKLKPGARIVSHQFNIPGVPAAATRRLTSMEDGDTHALFLWNAPLKQTVP